MKLKETVPVIADESQNLCPVCGKRSYSAAGMHPQCAQRQAEAVQEEEMAGEIKAKELPTAKASRQQRSWMKKCPKCNAEVHIRLKICSCGHKFSGR